MHNPPHPGEFIREMYLKPLNISAREMAAKLHVSPSTVNRLLQGRSKLSAEMALRLSKTLGRSAESWLLMQNQYSLWQDRQRINLDEVEPLQIHVL